MTTEEPWKELYSYWRSRQVDGRAPKRSELDIPVEVPRLLPNIMLIDCIGDRLRYRLVGTATWDRYQAELTGTWIEERNAAEAEWRGTIALVRDDGVPRLVSSPSPGKAADRISRSRCRCSTRRDGSFRFWPAHSTRRNMARTCGSAG